MAKVKTSKRYTAKQKARAVNKVKSGYTMAGAADLVGTTAESVATWVAQDAGFSDATEQRKATAKFERGPSLPVKSLKLKTTKMLVPKVFECPHCGGRVEVAS